jgi:hypothetical protein
MGDTFTGWSGFGPEPDVNITIGPDTLNYEGAVYEDSIFSNIPIVGPIIDWIEAQINLGYSWLASMFTSIINGIINGVRNIFNSVLTSISTAVTWIQTKLLDAWYWVSSKIPAAIEWIKVKLDTVWSWVTTAIPHTLSLIGSSVSAVMTKVQAIPAAIVSAADNVIRSMTRVLGSFFDPICDSLNSIFRGTRALLPEALAANSPEVRNWVLSWWPTGTPLWTYVQAAVKFVVMLPKLIADHFGRGLAIIFGENTAGWGDRIQGDITKITDTTEGLPQFINNNVATPILGGIKELWDKLTGILKAAFDLIWDALKKFFTEILPGWFRTLWDALHTAVSWVWDKVSGVAGFFLDEVLKLVGIHSPITPEGGLGTLKGMVKIGLALAGGLGLMTVAGNLVHPLHSLGLEHISAMVYDMTNYRALIGAGIGVIAACAIRIPLTHYFNEILRPNIPSERDVSEMYNRELIDKKLYFQYLGYRGYPTLWHEPLARITETPIRYFTLAAIAKAGYYDQSFFEAQLVRGGYDPETRTALHRMLQGTYTENLKGMMSGTAIKRYKEGMSSKAQFQAELKLLGYTDQQFPQYLAAADLEYATDYIGDLISAFRDAAAKGQISLDDFRSKLGALGVVPQRIEAYVLRIRARLDPAGPLKPIGPPKPEYQTEAGQVKVDTLRRQRQKELITRDQEIAGVQALGGPIEYATAIADNDDARLAAAAVSETAAPKPVYETDAGKIIVDTIRRQRRKDLITREDEVAGLMELEMTELYATAIADNDDARLAEKGGLD